MYNQRCFLPIQWEADGHGIRRLAWRDDPLQSQIVLSPEDYRGSFPKNELYWPALGEILLPEGTEASIHHSMCVEPDGNVLRLTFTVRNTGTADTTLEYVRLALPLDQCFRHDDVFKYEQNVLRHSGLIGQNAICIGRRPAESRRYI